VLQTKFFIKSFFLYTVKCDEYQTDFFPVPEWKFWVMAHLKALETRHDFESRLNWKLNLAKRLYGQG
jgi:hypothetical protein